MKKIVKTFRYQPEYSAEVFIMRRIKKMLIDRQNGRMFHMSAHWTNCLSRRPQIHHNMNGRPSNPSSTFLATNSSPLSYV